MKVEMSNDDKTRHIRCDYSKEKKISEDYVKTEKTRKWKSKQKADDIGDGKGLGGGGERRRKMEKR